jgi:pyruvate dehydrogenase E1 component alpha subunit
MRKLLRSFSVEWLQVLDENGASDEALMPPLHDGDVRKMYEAMVLARVFDATALKLQREGRMLTYASMLGQEASLIGPAYALGPDDWLVPSYRESGASMVKGMPPETLYAYWAGDERGNAIPLGLRHMTISVPVSTQILYSVGMAWAAKRRGEKSAVLTYFGDGATSKGDFSEGLNWAGVFRTPNVFACVNNQWAISLPRSQQSAAETLAQKAVAYGIRGIQVDGNDVFATYLATKEALEFARKGTPTLIELYTYRISDHTTADDAKKYRDPAEVEMWKRRDPIDRLRKYMAAKGLWDKAYGEKVSADAEKTIGEAVQKEESMPPQALDEIFRHVYAEMPQKLKEQLEELTKQ